jgi:hypothetical protein
MPTFPARFSFPVCTLALLSLLSPAASRAEPVFTDAFDGATLEEADGCARFWTLLLPDDNRDSYARKTGGLLHLRAATKINTYASLVSPTLKDFGFFARPLTITLDDITLKADGIPESDARFKLSLTSTEERAEKAPDAISLRIRRGLLLFGYRIDGFEPATSPENLSGVSANSVVAQPLAGLPSRISLTLGPAPSAGFIRYEIHAEGNGVSFSHSGTFPLTRAQWGDLDSASLVLDARRDNKTEQPDSAAELTLGKITVTR